MRIPAGRCDSNQIPAIGFERIIKNGLVANGVCTCQEFRV